MVACIVKLLRVRLSGQKSPNGLTATLRPGVTDEEEVAKSLGGFNARASALTGSLAAIDQAADGVGWSYWPCGEDSG
jgi:hypothetical protein